MIRLQLSEYGWGVIDEPSLFGDEPTQPELVDPPRVPAISNWQVDRLREALDSHGLMTMDERQRAGKGPSGKSAWDDREEDTWIDRL